KVPERAGAGSWVLLAGQRPGPSGGLPPGSGAAFQQIKSLNGPLPSCRVKIAILGTRGIPASYSGFETAVEQLAWRLSDRGHEVIVYCRPHVVDRNLTTYRGARLVHLPTVRNKYLDTFVHTFLSAVHAARVLKPDAAL